jgi:hypothetical protein
MTKTKEDFSNKKIISKNEKLVFVGIESDRYAGLLFHYSFEFVDLNEVMLRMANNLNRYN